MDKETEVQRQVGAWSGGHTPEPEAPTWACVPYAPWVIWFSTPALINPFLATAPSPLEGPPTFASALVQRG